MLKIFILTLMISTIRADASCFCKDYTYNTKKNQVLFDDPTKIPEFLEEILKTLVAKYQTVSESQKNYPEIQLISFLHGTRNPSKINPAKSDATSTTDSVARRMVFSVKNREKKRLFDFVYLYIEAIEMKKKKNFSLHFSSKRRDDDTVATELKFATAYALVDKNYPNRKKSALGVYAKEISESHAFNQYHSNEFAHDTCVHFSIFLNKILRVYFGVDSYKVVNQVSPLGILYHESGEKCSFVPQKKLEFEGQTEISEQRMSTPNKNSGRMTPISRSPGLEDEDQEDYQRRDGSKDGGNNHPTFIVKRQESSPLRQRGEGGSDLPLLGRPEVNRREEFAPRRNRFEDTDLNTREREASPSNNGRKQIKKDVPIKNLVPAKNDPTLAQKNQIKAAKDKTPKNQVPADKRDNRFKELVPNGEKKPSAWKQKMQKYKEEHPEVAAAAQKNKKSQEWSPVTPQKQAVEQAQELRQRNSPNTNGFGLIARPKKSNEDADANKLPQKTEAQVQIENRFVEQPADDLEEDEEDFEDFRPQVQKKDSKDTKINIVKRIEQLASEEDLEADRRAVSEQVFLPNIQWSEPTGNSVQKIQTQKEIEIEDKPLIVHEGDIDLEEKEYSEYLKSPQALTNTVRLRHAMQLKFGEVVLSEEEEIVYMEQLKLVLSNAQRSIEQIMNDYELVLKSGLFIDDDKGKTVYFASGQQEEELFKLDHPGNPIYFDFYKPDYQQILDFKIKSKFVEHMIDLIAQLADETPENKELLGFPDKFTFKIYTDLTMKISPNSALKRLLMIALAYNEYQLKPVMEIQSEVDNMKAALSLEFTYLPERSRLVGQLLFWRNTDMLTEARRRQLIQEAMNGFMQSANIDPSTVKSSNIEVLVSQMSTYRMLI